MSGERVALAQNQYVVMTPGPFSSFFLSFVETLWHRFHEWALCVTLFIGGSPEACFIQIYQ